MKTQRIIPFLAILVATACSTVEEVPQQREALALADATVQHQRSVPDASVASHDDSKLTLTSPDMLLDVVPSSASASSTPVVEELVEPEPAPVATFRLRHGETLHYFAKWSGLPVEVIAEASGLDLAGNYAVGEEVVIPSTGVDIAAVETAREAHWNRRIEGYLASRGGALGSDFHTVATGETAWSISRESNGIPVWLLASYNPDVSLDALRPGEKLLVPVLADIVVDAADSDESGVNSAPVVP